jgi:hypothetical protein
MNTPAINPSTKWVLDIDVMENGISGAENAIAFEAKGLLSFHSQRAVAIESALDACGKLAAQFELYVSNLIMEADLQYFEAHPTRSFTYRLPCPGEPLLSLCGFDPTFVVIRQLSKGVRLLCPIRFAFGPMTEAERFNRARYSKSMDQDWILQILFNQFCANPGKELSARVFIAMARGTIGDIANAVSAMRNGSLS